MTDKRVKITLHLIVTNLCDRTCHYCCNKKYNTINTPYASENDFTISDGLCLTGGEPFVYANPCNLARRYRKDYPHLSYIVVYTNAKELYQYLCDGGKLHDIDGLNISCKTLEDVEIFNRYLVSDDRITSLNMNRLYDFTNKAVDSPHFLNIHRTWQADFVPAESCLFRRGN